MDTNQIPDKQSSASKRYRRTKEAVETDMLQAAAEIIAEVGFKDINISRILQKAKIEPGVFYNRYQDLDDFLEKFVRKYDYWLNDTACFDPTNPNPIQNLEDVVIGLIEGLNTNKVMQQLLAWEIMENNFITRRTADNRERHAMPVMDYFNDSFKNSPVDFNVFAAIIISGIYYIILHKNMNECKLCKVDFNSEDGLNLLKQTVKNIISLVYKKSIASEETFRYLDTELKTKLAIAKKLKDQNITYKTIKEVTALTEEELKSVGVLKRKPRKK